MNASYPRITIIMPVFNGELYLREAIDSMLEQTFKNFELLIINDGSNDSSAEIVSAYNDPRIRQLENDSNIGLAATLNRGITLARGEYIARMDCDDISLPRRLERQVQFMDEHPEIGISGTWMRTFGAKTETIRFLTNPLHVRCDTFLNCGIGHPTVIMRKSSMDEHRLRYDPGYHRAQDYALWAKALKHFEMANLGEVHLLYRLHAQQASSVYVNEQNEAVHRIRHNLISELDIDVSISEYTLHSWLASPTLQKAREADLATCRVLINSAQGWFDKLAASNNVKKIYPQPIFSRMLLCQWLIMYIQLLLVKGPMVAKGFNLFIIIKSLQLSNYDFFVVLTKSLYCLFRTVCLNFKSFIYYNNHFNSIKN